MKSAQLNQQIRKSLSTVNDDWLVRSHALPRGYVEPVKCKTLSLLSERGKRFLGRVEDTGPLAVHWRMSEQ